MRIQLMMPKSTVFDKKPTSYYWLEANLEEALDVIARVKMSGDALRYYLQRIEQVRNFVPGQFDEDDPTNNLFEDIVGFVISADGKKVQATDMHYPISNQWMHNPFREVGPYFLKSLDDLNWITHNIEQKYPAYADRFDYMSIPNRVDLRQLRGRTMESLIKGIPRDEKQALEAADDLLAMAIFLNTSSAHEKHPHSENFKPDNDLAYELQRQFNARGEAEWQGYLPRYPFGFTFFKASYVPVYEIFQRRARADFNTSAVLEGLHQEQSLAFDQLQSRFESYSDDEFCEMFLLHWFYDFKDFVTKAYINVMYDRLRGISTNPNLRVGADWTQDLPDEPGVIRLAGPHLFISENPFLGPDFEDLVTVLAALLDSAKGQEFCIMQTYGHKYSLNPNASPYMQAMWNKDSLYVELAGNIICNPPLNEKQIKELEFMGWTPPGDGIPNFVRTYDQPNAYLVADFVLTSLASIYGIQSDDFFSFGSPQATAFIDQMRLLDRLSSNPRNASGTIFCIRGKHNDLL